MFSIWNFDLCNINFRSLSICCLREWIRGWSINAFIQVFPPGCLLSNPINAVTTKFVRTSTNKLRCPIFCVAVSINDFVVHQYLHGRLGALLSSWILLHPWPWYEFCFHLLWVWCKTVWPLLDAFGWCLDKWDQTSQCFIKRGQWIIKIIAKTWFELSRKPINSSHPFCESGTL